jgi:aminoglycoside phosphotransferase (APT) family kinase protein
MNPTEIATSLGWTVESQAIEGNATRLHVVKDQTRALLYVFDDPVLAARMAWSHRPDRAAQLFSVPEVIDSAECWCLIQPINGITISALMERSNESVVTQELARELGELLRKLHSTNLSTESVFGDTLPTGSRWLTFNGYVAAQFERFAEDVRTLDLDDETTTAIMGSIGQIRQELASFHPRSPTTLVHGKIDFQHIWVDEHARNVVAVTGFDTSAILPAEVDLAWLLWIKGFDADELARSLYRGYGAARTMDVQRRERFFRRLVAFHALYGDFGNVSVDRDRLVKLAVETA